MADPQARYVALDPDERRILRVLSVVCEPVGQTSLQQVLDALQWRAQSGAPLSRLLGKLMTGLLTPKPAWEIALAALNGLGDQPSAGDTGAAPAAEQRMAWLLTLYAETATLEPREQKRLKRGGWTQGRPVALARLVEEPDSFSYLTP